MENNLVGYDMMMGDFLSKDLQKSDTGLNQDQTLIQDFQSTLVDLKSNKTEDNLDNEITQVLEKTYPGLTSIKNLPIEKLSQSDEFINAREPINQGSYQGSMIGSAPIFAAGGAIFPMEVVRARQRAMGNALTQKKNTRDRIYKMALAKGAVQYNDIITDKGFGLVEKYLDQYGSFENIMKSDRGWLEFQQEIMNHRNVAALTVSIDEQARAIINDVGNDKKYYPPSAINTAQKFVDGFFKGDLDQWYEDPNKLAKIHGEMEQFTNLQTKVETLRKSGALNNDAFPINTMISEALDDPEKANKILDAYYQAQNTGDYRFLVKATMSTVGDDRLMGLAEMIKTSGSFAQSKDEIFEMLSSTIADELKLDEVVLNKFNEGARKRLGEAAGAGNQPVVQEGFFTSFRNKIIPADGKGAVNPIITEGLSTSTTATGTQQTLKVATGRDWEYSKSNWRTELSLPSNSLPKNQVLTYDQVDMIEDPSTGTVYSTKSFFNKVEDLKKQIEDYQSLQQSYDNFVVSNNYNVSSENLNRFYDDNNVSNEDRSRFTSVQRLDKMGRNAGATTANYNVTGTSMELKIRNADGTYSNAPKNLFGETYETVKDNLTYVVTVEYTPMIEDVVQGGIIDEQSGKGTPIKESYSNRGMGKVFKTFDLQQEGDSQALDAMMPGLSTQNRADEKGANVKTNYQVTPAGIDGAINAYN